MSRMRSKIRKKDKGVVCRGNEQRAEGQTEGGRVIKKEEEASVRVDQRGKDGEGGQLNIHYQSTGEKSTFLLILCVGLLLTSTPNNSEAIWYMLCCETKQFYLKLHQQHSSNFIQHVDTSHLITQHETEL